MGVIFLQMGDLAATADRMARGLPETYRDQHRSVRHVMDLARDRPVVVVSPENATGDGARSSHPAPGLRTIGIPSLETGAVGDLIAAMRPRQIVLRVPRADLLALALRSGAHVLPGYADLFARGGRMGGLRGRWRNHRHARLLDHPNVPCVANHNLNASRSVRDVLGVPAARIVPWDWSRVPEAAARAIARAPGDPFRIFYAGLLTEAKGVGDLIAAAGLLAGSGVDVTLRLAGKGEAPEVWAARAAAAGLAPDRLTLPGLISNAQVRAEMAAADAVAVPSRPSYDEGLPNTIYEALAARAPLVLSDHPAFAGRVTPGRDALIALADALGRIAADPALAQRLSDAAPSAHARLYAGMDWCDLVDRFLADPEDRTSWVAAHALTTFEDGRAAA